MLLKDLWNGDLPLGGDKSIGRGVLQGHWAQINLKDGTNLKICNKDIKNEQKLLIEGKEQMEAFVQALSKECKTRGGGEG